MNIQFTARRFKAHDSLRQYALDAMKKLDRIYDGVIDASIILSYERAYNSVKIAEIQVKVYGAVLTAAEKSDDFMKSIDAAVEKMERQLRKYKEKLHNR
ncbi:MAG: ribosome hibernation-promoting factor, HPF/YfiA family [Bacteroidota bacterium]